MDIPISRYFDILKKYLVHQKPQAILLTIFVLTSIGLQVVNPQIMRFFIDSATTGVSTQVLTLAAVAFIGIALLQQVLAVSGTYMGESVAWTATNALREDLAEHCLRLDMTFHNDRSPGELIERIEGDVTEFSTFFSMVVVRVAGNILLLAGIIVALFIIDWRLGCVYVVFAALTLVTLNTVRGVAVPHMRAMRDANTDLFGFLEERLAGTEDIRSCGAVGYVIRRLFELQTVILRRWRKASLMQVLVGVTAGIMLVFGLALTFVSGYYLI